MSSNHRDIRCQIRGYFQRLTLNVGHVATVFDQTSIGIRIKSVSEREASDQS